MQLTFPNEQFSLTGTPQEVADFVAALRDKKVTTSLTLDTSGNTTISGAMVTSGSNPAGI